MAYTVVAYTQSIDSATLADIDAIADPHVRVEGKNIIVPHEYNSVLGVAALGANITQARLVSPSLRRIVNLDIYPIERAATFNVNMPRFFDLSSNPVRLDEDEVLNFQASEDAAGASQVYGIVFLGAGSPSPVSGDIRTVLATSTDAVTANRWSNIKLTFAQSLPAGRYQIVGAQHVSANGIAFRFVFVGGIWRPGGLSATSRGANPYPLFQEGRLGVWGEFAHNTPPTVDVLASAADASHDVYIDLIKIA